MTRILVDAKFYNYTAKIEKRKTIKLTRIYDPYMIKKIVLVDVKFHNYSNIH